MPVVNAADLKPDRRIHALVIGPSGVGKTAGELTFPGRTHILDFDDRGEGPAKGCVFLQDKVRKREIEINRILPWVGTVPQGLAVVYRELESLDARVTSGEIQNVILSSTTSVKRFFINESVNHGLKTSGRASSMAHFKIGEAIMAQKADYNYCATCMLNLIYDNLKTFKCNVFVETHLKDKVIASPTQEDPERVIVVGQTITAPGQLAIEIPTWFNEVWEFELDATIKSAPPRRFVNFQGLWARTSFRDLGEWKDEKGTKVWKKAHRLEITDKSLYEVLKPTFDRMESEGKEAAK